VSVRQARWLLFFALALTLPTPMLVAFDALVPPIRYVILAGAALSVALAEGAAGPVPGIILLLVAHAAVYLLLAWLGAWLAAHLLRPFSPRARGRTAFGVVVLLLFLSLAFALYRTPFGHARTANLLGVLS